MTLPGAADIEMMRTAQETAHPDTALVKRRVRVANTSGGFTETWPATTHTYACRLSLSGVPREYLQMAAMRNVIPWMVTFTHDANVIAGDHLVIESRTLEILGFASGGTWKTALRVVCVEVT